MEFEKVSIAHLGASSEDGQTLIAEIDRRIQELSEQVLDDRYTDNATITVKIGISAEGEGVIIDGKVEHKAPSIRRKALHGFMSGEGLVKQKADQLPLLGTDVIKMARAAKKEE